MIVYQDNEKATLYDVDGNVIDAHPDADGDYHSGVAVIQSIITSSKNFTTTNLSAGETFTGDADETFGVNGIQIFHSADQDCTVYIDQSIDNTFTDSTQTIPDSFPTLANVAETRTYMSVAPYYRIRITNTGTSATTKIGSYTGMTPIVNPLPRSLSDDGRLEVETTITGRENTDRHVFVSPLNALTTTGNIRLVGTSFDGLTKDPNFWSETGTVNGGSVTQAGAELVMASGTNAAGAAVYQTTDSARFVVSRPMRFLGFFAIKTAPVAGNVRRIGAYTATDGFFFQMNELTFQIVTRKASSDTPISNGSFNGNYGPSWTAEVGDIYYRLEIEWGAYGINFYIDGKLLHTLPAGHWSNYYSLPVRMENINTGSTTDSHFDCIGASITGQGELATSPRVQYATNGTTVLKYGPGDLHRITVTDNTGTMLVYDGLSAAGKLIANLDASKTVGTMEFGAPFSTGLTVVVASSPKMTVVYE